MKRIPLKQAMLSGRFAELGVGDLFRDSDNSVWKVEAGEDGQEYIVRTDMRDGNIVESSDNQEWCVASDGDQTTLTLLYKDVPMQKFEASQCGFDKNTIVQFARFLLKKATNKQFVRKVVASQSGQYRTELQKKFPELGE